MATGKRSGIAGITGITGITGRRGGRAAAAGAVEAVDAVDAVRGVEARAAGRKVAASRHQRAEGAGDDPAPGAPGAKDAGWIAIGELARRSGVPASALRFYEERGLIQGSRSPGGQRRYPRHVLRRIGFIRVAQSVGLGLDEIAAALAALPEGRTPTKADWQRLSSGWAPLLDARIAALQALRGQLTACIGCGCLSLKSCKLYNPGDAARARGAGPRYLLGDRPGSAPRPR